MVTLTMLECKSDMNRNGAKGLLTKLSNDLCSRASAFPVGGARFTLKFNYIGRVFIIWVSDSIAGTVLM